MQSFSDKDSTFALDLFKSLHSRNIILTKITNNVWQFKTSLTWRKENFRTMKKTYLKPTMMVVPVQTTQMLCVSIESNVDLKYGGQTDDDFEER